MIRIIILFAILVSQKAFSQTQELAFSLTPSYNIGSSYNRSQNTFGYSTSLSYRYYWAEKNWFWATYIQYKYRTKKLYVDRLADLVNDKYEITEKKPKQDALSHYHHFLNLKGSVGYSLYSKKPLNIYIEMGLIFPFNISTNRYVNDNKQSNISFGDIYFNNFSFIADPFVSISNIYTINPNMSISSGISYTLENIFMNNIRPGFHSLGIVVSILYNI